MKFGSHAAAILDDAIDATRAHALRAQLAGWRRYALLDRGSYELVPDLEPALFADIAALAGVSAIREATALRLVPGDYILAHHDRFHDRVHDDLPLELVLDLSPAPCAADIHYRRRGAVFFRVPCVPRSLAIVERSPAVTRNHVYLSKRPPAAEVIRIVMIATPKNRS